MGKGQWPKEPKSQKRKNEVFKAEKGPLWKEALLYGFYRDLKEIAIRFGIFPSYLP